MIILGIETSCDETGAAIVENGTKILANTVASSAELHQKTGGIIPEVAAREQIKCIIPVINEALESSKLKIDNLDAVGVTAGPGLIGSLLVGVETARTLAYVWKKPIIPVNHLQAHLYANFLNSNSKLLNSNLFPAVALVVSGGHTDLVLIKNHGRLKWLGSTRDDAAGECFDKCARLLGLGYPGGPAIEREALKFIIRNVQSAIRLPRPMINQKNYDFSFSGLKTAVLHQCQKSKKEISPKYRNQKFISSMAKEVQEAIVDVLVTKTIRAAKEHQAHSILLAGGVSANQRLREKMQLKIKNLRLETNFHVPPKPFCIDNAAMVAACSYFNFHPAPWQKIKADPSLNIEEMI